MARSLANKLAAGAGTALGRIDAAPAAKAPAAPAVRFLEIDPARIAPNPDQPRRVFDQADLCDLAVSLKEHGVLQPLTVRMDGDAVVLVAGERRLRAAKLAGLTRVPCTVTDGDPAVLAMIENLHRKDLTPLEEAEGLARLQESHGLDLRGLAMIAGKAKSTVSELLSLAKLPQAVKDKAKAQPGKFPRRLLVELAKEPPKRAEALATAAAAGAHKAEDVRAERRERKAKAAPKPAAEPAAGPTRRAEGDSPNGRIDALFRRAEDLVAELDRLDLPGLNYRQRTVARHACKRLAQSLDRVFNHLKQAARQDAERWTPARQEKLLALIESGGLSYAGRIMGKEINEDGKPLHPSEVAAQVALARQAEKARAAELKAVADEFADAIEARRAVTTAAGAGDQ